MIYIAQGYPEASPDYQIKQQYNKFYSDLGKVLPCENCQENYQKHISQHPPDLSGRQALLDWLYHIHNQTLIDQNRAPLPSTDSFINKYTNGNTASSSKPILIILALVALALAAYYLARRR